MAEWKFRDDAKDGARNGHLFWDCSHVSLQGSEKGRPGEGKGGEAVSKVHFSILCERLCEALRTQYPMALKTTIPLYHYTPALNNCTTVPLFHYTTALNNYTTVPLYHSTRALKTTIPRHSTTVPLLHTKNCRANTVSTVNIIYYDMNCFQKKFSFWKEQSTLSEIFLVIS